MFDLLILNYRVFIYHFNIEYEIEQQSSVDEVLQAVYREMINSYSTTLPKNNIKRKSNHAFMLVHFSPTQF